MYPYPLIPGTQINLYGLMTALGILACFGVLFLYSKKLKYDSRFTDFVFYNAVISIAIGYIFAALFQAFYNYLEHPEDGFRFGSGITFIGGLIGGAGTFLVVYFLFKKRAHGSIVNLLSLAPCCIVIAHAFGRLGCLFAGCCHGDYLGPDPVLGGVYMKGTVDGFTKWGYFVPIQLYEALFLFALFTVMTILLLKFKFQHNLSIYLICYGIFRFVNEFFRTDSRGHFIGSLSPSQFWSLVMIVIGVGLIFFMNYLLKRTKANEQN